MLFALLAAALATPSTDVGAQADLRLNSPYYRVAGGRLIGQLWLAEGLAIHVSAATWTRPTWRSAKGPTLQILARRQAVVVPESHGVAEAGLALTVSRGTWTFARQSHDLRLDVLLAFGAIRTRDQPLWVAADSYGFLWQPIPQDEWAMTHSFGLRAHAHMWGPLAWEVELRHRGYIEVLYGSELVHQRHHWLSMGPRLNLTGPRTR
ncbi:MAG: hypothetical protein KC912_10215 [Proteobacteria bacterium]|nr:hypothetical protein [Pseudomonadota bacterium]